MNTIYFVAALSLLGAPAFAKTPKSKEPGCSTIKECAQSTPVRNAVVNECKKDAGAGSEDFCACTFAQFSQLDGMFDKNGNLSKSQQATLEKNVAEYCLMKIPGADDFMNSCKAAAGGSASTAYCRCGFENFVDLGFTKKSALTSADKAKLEKTTINKCGQLLSDDTVDGNFLRSCKASSEASAGAKAEPLCKCVLSELRTAYKHPSRDLMGSTMSKKMEKDSNAAIKTCVNK